MNVKCKILGHKWTAIYMGHQHKGKLIRFVACYCARCDFGREGLLKMASIEANKMSTYSQEIFNNKSQKQ